MRKVKRKNYAFFIYFFKIEFFFFNSTNKLLIKKTKKVIVTIIIIASLFRLKLLNICNIMKKISLKLHNKKEGKKYYESINIYPCNATNSSSSGPSVLILVKLLCLI